ncbi:hypothetical protein SAMN04490183_0257 [Pseudomonas corrugata]|nr:hypothetical protein SAMN04490183_0257 [Pseudomonas corrugata]
MQPSHVGISETLRRVSEDSDDCVVPLWRGGLSPLGCEAALKPDYSVYQAELSLLLWGCCAAQRG